jgi:uncharacterized membrane protein YwaF
MGLLIYLIITKQNWMKKHQKQIIFFFLALLLYSLYLRYFERLFDPRFSYDIKDLPTAYCRISVILAAIYLITRNKYLGQFLYFQAGFGVFSMVFPGTDFFYLTAQHRNIGYVYDHLLLSLLPFFIVLIMGVTPSKKSFYISWAYCIVIPFALLPYALSSGTNAFYILDAAFADMVFGDNQIIISIVYIIGVSLYNIVMYFFSKYLVTLRTENTEIEHFFYPVSLWISLVSVLVVGLFIGQVVIDQTPQTVKDLTTTYIDYPIRTLEEFGYVYQGEDENGDIFFVELIKRFEEIEVMDLNGNKLEVSEQEGIFYYVLEDAETDEVIILLYKNKDTDDVKLRSYIVK